MRPVGKLREEEAEKEISYLGGRSGSRGSSFLQKNYAEVVLVGKEEVKVMSCGSESLGSNPV